MPIREGGAGDRKPLQRKTGLKQTEFKAAGAGLTRSSGLSTSGPAKAPASPYEAERKANQRAALNALKRARRAAEAAGISLSDWEGEFIASVSEAIETHGRAFGDPEKGAPGQAVSRLQGRKLKEIAAKANGEAPKRRWDRKAPPNSEPDR